MNIFKQIFYLKNVKICPFLHFYCVEPTNNFFLTNCEKPNNVNLAGSASYSFAWNGIRFLCNDVFVHCLAALGDFTTRHRNIPSRGEKPVVFRTLSEMTHPINMGRSKRRKQGRYTLHGL